MPLSLDLPQILAHASSDSPAGEDLRSDSNPNNLYRRIRDTRNAARDREARDDRGDPRRNDESSAIELWDKVWELGTDYLANTARDLEVAACLIEASIRLDGAAGFALSLDLTSALIKDFWGNIYPLPDEDGIETTLLPIARLNGDPIFYPLQRIPITESYGESLFVIWQYEQAHRVAKLQSEKPEEAQKLLSKGAASIEALQQAVRDSSDSFYQSLNNDLKQASAALEKFQETLEAKVTDESAIPNLSRFRDGLREASGVLQNVAGPRLQMSGSPTSIQPNSNAQISPNASSAGNSPGAAVSIPGSINSREDALATLERVAQWFQTHEPQSLLPSQIRKAVRRGRMTPEQLCLDLIEDESVLKLLFKDVGIIPAKQDE
jgi:type VI secretion system protein ImpA